MAREVLILGAGFLGVNVALNVMDEKEVTLIDDDMQHQYVPGTIELLRERLREGELQADLESLLDGIELVEEEVIEIRPNEKVVETNKGLYGYEQLVIGLGGEPRDFGLDIGKAENVWSIEAAKNLRKELENSEKAIVVGSGYTGLEVAGEIAEKSIETMVVEAKTRPTPNLSEGSSERFLEMMQERGVSFRGGVEVREILEDGVRTDSGKIEADTVVWCGGVQASKVVQESLRTDEKGVKVNRGLSAEGYRDVFAGGDSANTGALKTAHNAMKQADIIGENLLRENRELKRFRSDTSPIAVSFGDIGALIYDQRIRWTGFPSRRMKDWVRKYYFFRLKWKKLM